MAIFNSKAIFFLYSLFAQFPKHNPCHSGDVRSWLQDNLSLESISSGLKCHCRWSSTEPTAWSGAAGMPLGFALKMKTLWCLKGGLALMFV